MKIRIKSCGNIELRTKRMHKLGLQDLFEKYESNEDRCIKCINYKIKYGKYPSADAIDIKIRRLGQWLGKMRGAYHDKNKSKFDNSLLVVAERLGVSDMFDYINHEIKQLNICMNFIEFVKSNNRTPKHNSNNSDEKYLAIWLTKIKLAKQGKNNSRFFNSVENLLVDSGLSYVLIPTNLIHYNDLVTFLSMNGRYPTQAELPVLCKWLTYMRRMYKEGNFIHNNLLELAKKDGYPDMFTSIDIEEQTAVSNCKKIIEFIFLNGRYPYQNKNNNSDEHKLAVWITAQRNNSLCRTILKTMATEAGFPNMFNSNWKSDFDYLDNKTIKMYDKLKYYIHNNDVYDKTNSATNRNYSTWIHSVKSNSQTAYDILYKKSIIDKISIQFIYVLNETMNMDEYDIKKMNEGITNISNILLHLHTHNAYPTCVTDRFLYKWLDKMRQAKKGNNNNKFYDEYDKMTIKSGYPNMFNKNWRDDIRK